MQTSTDMEKRWKPYIFKAFISSFKMPRSKAGSQFPQLTTCNLQMDFKMSDWSNAWPTAVPPKPVEPVQQSLITPELEKRLTAANLPVTNDGVLMLWQKTKEILAEAKEDEMEIRKTAVRIYVPKPSEGTNTVELGNGFELKAKINYNYNLAANDVVEATLNEIEKIGNEGKFIADRLVSWTPNFLLTEYRKITEEAEGGSKHAQEIMKLIPKMLTITEAAPSLEIKEPKKKRK